MERNIRNYILDNEKKFFITRAVYFELNSKCGFSIGRILAYGNPTRHIFYDSVFLSVKEFILTPTVFTARNEPSELPDELWLEPGSRSKRSFQLWTEVAQIRRQFNSL